MVGVDDYIKAIDDKVPMVINGAQLSVINPQQNIFNSGVLRGKADNGSHTKNGRRHGSSGTSVIIFLR